MFDLVRKQVRDECPACSWAAHQNHCKRKPKGYVCLLASTVHAPSLHVARPATACLAPKAQEECTSRGPCQVVWHDVSPGPAYIADVLEEGVTCLASADNQCVLWQACRSVCVCSLALIINKPQQDLSLLTLFAAPSVAPSPSVHSAGV